MCSRKQHRRGKKNTHTHTTKREATRSTHAASRPRKSLRGVPGESKKEPGAQNGTPTKREKGRTTKVGDKPGAAGTKTRKRNKNTRCVCGCALLVLSFLSWKKQKNKKATTTENQREKEQTPKNNRPDIKRIFPRYFQERKTKL